MTRRKDDCRKQWEMAKADAALMFDVGKILDRWRRNDPCWRPATVEGEG